MIWFVYGLVFASATGHQDCRKLVPIQAANAAFIGSIPFLTFVTSFLLAWCIGFCGPRCGCKLEEEQAQPAADEESLLVDGERHTNYKVQDESIID